MTTYEINCDICGDLLKQIGPFADSNLDDKEVQKWDGKIDFQCVNVQCSNYQRKITLNPNEYTFMDQMNEVCKCGHARGVHGNLFSEIPEGQSIPKIEKNKKCEVDECDCVEFSVVS